MKQLFSITILFCASVYSVQAQRTIHGHIYGGQNNTSPIDSIKLSTASGNITFTNKLGGYNISINDEKDTLYVSYKGREMTRFYLSKNTTPDKFDIYLNNIDYFKDEETHELKQVQVHTKNYHDDSLRTRYKYGDIYTYKKPTFKYGKDWIILPFYVNVNIDNLIRLAQVNRTKQKWRDRKFALTSEEQLYIDSRFTRSLAGRITHLDDDKELFAFMEWCRPTAGQLRLMNDLELNQYILDNFRDYEKCKAGKEDSNSNIVR